MNEPSHDEQRTTTTELQNPTDTIVDADKWACICTCAPKPEGPGSLPCPGNNSQNKKKTKKHPLAANNITLTGTGVGCEFFSMCNFRGPQPSDMQMRGQAQPRSLQPTANSKQPTARNRSAPMAAATQYILFTRLCVLPPSKCHRPRVSAA